MNEDKATRYQRLKRQAEVASFVWNAGLLVAVLASGLSVRMRVAAESIAPNSTILAIVIYVVLLSLLSEAVGLPLALYSGFILERRYGLSNQTPAGWALDEVKASAIGLLFGSGAALVLYLLIAASPDHWWMIAGGIFCLIILGLANLAPVVLLPLFYQVKPLDRDALRARLLAIADRAGARVLGVYEWGMSGKTKKANAALAGLGGTRRILVSDTMLAEYSDEEIEVVLAHELAHHVHGDIWKGLALQSTLLLAGFYLASRLLQTLAGTVGLRGVPDVAGLPLLLLSGGAVSALMLPVAHAMSRAFERRADRFALDLTRNPGAFVSAMRRLAAQNLAEEHPSKIIEWIFYSHPPIRERIAAAQAFKT